MVVVGVVGFPVRLGGGGCGIVMRLRVFLHDSGLVFICVCVIVVAVANVGATKWSSGVLWIDGVCYG